MMFLVMWTIVFPANFVCYHGTWAKYRTGNGTFNVASIDTSHCTHLIYSFMGIKSDGTLYSLDEYLDVSLGNLNAFTALKSVRSNLKVLAAVGGWSKSDTFPGVASSATARAVFLQSAIEFIQKYNFDGLDFDWEFPALRGGTSVDVQNFVTLLQEFKTAFEPLGLLVTAAVSASATSVSTSYDVPGISQYLDMINVMTYDLRGSWDGVTGHNAPLYASSIDSSSTDLELNVDACITNWIAQGAPPAKINLGIPLYGRTFTLASTSAVSLGAATTGNGVAGTYTQEAGYLGYNEIVALRNAGGWTYVWDDEQQVPHMYNGDQWVGFDDPAAVTLKVQYAQSKGLGGVMVWAIETDDFHGLSGIKNPLLNAISSQLTSGSDSNSTSTSTSTSTTTIPSTTTSTSTSTSTSTTTIPSTTTSTSTTTIASTTTSTVATSVDNNDSTGSSSSSLCTRTGFVRDSLDCNKYYVCTQNTDGTFVTHNFTCNAGLYFDLTYSVCNYPSAVSDCS